MPMESQQETKNVHIATHPLIKHKLSLLRDVAIDKKQFNELVKEITMLLVYESTRNLPMTEQLIQTPLERFNAPVLEQREFVIIPILRAGLGMVDGFLSLLPTARVGHIGLFRDEVTFEPHSYYFKIPKGSEKAHYFVCDPMLATGGSAVEAINELNRAGITKIHFVCIVAAPQGIQTLHDAHPNMPIYCAGLDRELNDKNYILPGLGDAGDRLFGTI